MKTDNELIAEFMGIRVRYQGPVLYHCDEDGMIDWVDGADTYSPHLDWSDIMPVVVKISHLEYKLDSSLSFTDNERRKFELHDEQDNVTDIQIGHTDINHVYKAVVEFIKWYNSQKA